MGQVYTFHKTARGHLHVMNEIPCEDASTSFSADDGKYHIAIVADGHGDKACFRSEFGSKAVTEVALEYLQEFAAANLVSSDIENRFYQDMLSNPRYRQMTLRRLTDTIIAGWHDRVSDDYNDNPPSQEEMGDSAAEYQNGQNIAHIYGTTLIAALQLPGCLILLHQGDGRCDVFFDDGTVEQPIPWDLRCEDTATTSMCDDDVADSFRTCILDLTARPVIACYLGSDGVEDAYRDTYESLGGSHILMGGVHAFYKDLTCQIASRSVAEFEEYLDAMLPEFSADGRFSRSGSGDDVSVAGIVDIDAIQQFVELFQMDVKKYALEEDLFWAEDELRSKTRKHGILLKRANDAQVALDNANAVQQSLALQLQQYRAQRLELAGKVEQAETELYDYQKESEAVSGWIEGKNTTSLPPDAQNVVIKFMRIGAQTMQRLYEEIPAERNLRETAYQRLRESLLAMDNRIREIEKRYSDGADNLRILESALNEAQGAFNDYDYKYKAIDAERLRIQAKIAALSATKDEEL